MLTESVHSASSTLDSRHFAEEFLRRRKLADKGIIDTTSTASPAENKAGGGGGWSEVAKKGGAGAQAQQQSALDSGNFKVVAAKKKSGKRYERDDWRSSSGGWNVDQDSLYRVTGMHGQGGQ